MARESFPKPSSGIREKQEAVTQTAPPDRSSGAAKIMETVPASEATNALPADRTIPNVFLPEPGSKTVPAEQGFGEENTYVEREGFENTFVAMDQKDVERQLEQGMLEQGRDLLEQNRLNAKRIAEEYPDFIAQKSAEALAVMKDASLAPEDRDRRLAELQQEEDDLLEQYAHSKRQSQALAMYKKILNKPDQAPDLIHKWGEDIAGVIEQMADQAREAKEQTRAGMQKAERAFLAKEPSLSVMARRVERDKIDRMKMMMDDKDREEMLFHKILDDFGRTSTRNEEARERQQPKERAA